MILSELITKLEAIRDAWPEGERMSVCVRIPACHCEGSEDEDVYLRFIHVDPEYINNHLGHVILE